MRKSQGKRACLPVTAAVLKIGASKSLDAAVPVVPNLSGFLCCMYVVSACLFVCKENILCISPTTRTFFFTVIGFLQSGPDKGNTSIDIAVFNTSGFAVYQVDSSFGGTQFGDQPHVGFDNNALYAATDQFNVPGTAYFGAALFVISKSQLVATVPSPSLVSFGPLSLAGIPILTLQPAVSTTSTNTEYLLNSFPFADALITPNPVTQQLGF